MLTRLSDWLLIRPGEGRLVAYLFLIFLLLGLGMTVGQSSADALFFKRVGVESLPQMFLLTGVLLAVFSAAYAEFADQVPAHRLFQRIAVILILFLAGAWAGMRAGGTTVAFAAYFLGYGVASEILLVHVNLYVASFLNATQAKRIFPVVNAAARLGGVIGGVLVGVISAHLSVEDAPLVWAGILALTCCLILVRHRGERSARRAPGAARTRRLLGNLRDGLQFARGSLLLQVGGLGLLLMVVLISMQDYIANTIFTRHFRDERDLLAFFGWFAAVTNAVVLVLQLVLTNRLLRRFGLKAVSMIFPWSMAATFGLLALSATLVPAALARFNYRGLLPAFRNPSANLFFEALPSYMQGRARALTIGLILPLGLAAAGAMLMLVPREAVGESLAAGGFVLCLLYVAAKKWKNRVYNDALVRLIHQQVFVSPGSWIPDTAHLEAPVIEAIESELARGVDDNTFLALAGWLIRDAPQQAGQILLRHLPTRKPWVQDQLWAEVMPLAPGEAKPHIVQCLDASDTHLRATALRVLASSDPEMAARVVDDWLPAGEARLRAEAVAVGLGLAVPEVAARGHEALQRMLKSADAAEQVAALYVVKERGLAEYAEVVRSCAASPHANVRAAATLAAGKLAERGLAECAACIEDAARDSDPAVRRAALTAAAALPSADRRAAALAAALQDEAPEIRRAAREHAALLMPGTLDEYAALIRQYVAHFRMQSLLARHLALARLAGWEKELAGLVRDHLRRAWEKKSVADAAARMGGEVGKMREATEFLRLVLEEEVDRHLGLALETLGHLDAKRTADIVRAALTSKDDRLRAQAVELLRNLDDGEVVAQLLPLLEVRHDGARWQHRLDETPGDLPQTMKWCREHGGVWLRQVAAVLERELGFARTI